MEDPSTFTAPFSGELPFNRIDEAIYEYACHAVNYTTVLRTRATYTVTPRLFVSGIVQ
jgi:hypothetical protein